MWNKIALLENIWVAYVISISSAVCSSVYLLIDRFALEYRSGKIPYIDHDHYLWVKTRIYFLSTSTSSIKIYYLHKLSLPNTNKKSTEYRLVKFEFGRE